MKAVIMAGGRGTRIAALSKDLPKPMLPIDGRPILEWELESLREQGFTEVLITVGYLAPAIMDYFGDGSGCSPQTGKPFGVHIEYFVETEPLGNAGALFRIRDKLDKDFLLLNGDVMFDIDLRRFAAFHKAHCGLATLFTHPNGHPYDSGLIIADGDQRVTQWLTKEDARPQYYRNRVNAGLHILNPELLQGEIPVGKVDLDRQILKPLAGTGKLVCYDSPEYVKDMRSVQMCTVAVRQREIYAGSKKQSFWIETEPSTAMSVFCGSQMHLSCCRVQRRRFGKSTNWAGLLLW